MRAKIMLHAGREILRHGYEGAKLNRIVELAGITKGAVFHHFSSKEDLALLWMQQEVPRVLETSWGNELAATNDPIAALKSIFRHACSEEKEGSMILAALACGMDDAPKLREQVRLYHEEWHRLVAAALRVGQLHKTVHHAIIADEEAHMIVSLAQGMAWHGRTSGMAIMSGLLRSAVAYLDTLRPF